MDNTSAVSDNGNEEILEYDASMKETCTSQHSEVGLSSFCSRTPLTSDDPAQYRIIGGHINIVMILTMCYY